MPGIQKWRPEEPQRPAVHAGQEDYESSVMRKSAGRNGLRSGGVSDLGRNTGKQQDKNCAEKSDVFCGKME